MVQEPVRSIYVPKNGLVTWTFPAVVRPGYLGSPTVHHRHTISVDVWAGDIVCGDDDGVLVIPWELAEQVVTFAEDILKADQKARAQHYRDLGYEYDETLGEFGAETDPAAV